MKSFILAVVLLGAAAEFAIGDPIVFNPDNETLEGLQEQNRQLRRQIQELTQKVEQLEQRQDQSQGYSQNPPQVQIVIPGSYAYPDQTFGSFGWNTMGGAFIGAPVRDGHPKGKDHHDHSWREGHDHRR